MRTQPNLAIRVATAALALSACGVAVGISAGTSASAASAVSARHAPAETGSADLRDMAQVKRTVVRPANSSDSGLAGCASLSGGHEVAISDYPKLGDLFDSSRWPDLRISGLAWVEIVTKQHSVHAYGGNPGSEVQRLPVRCAGGG